MGLNNLNWIKAKIPKNKTALLLMMINNKFKINIIIQEEEMIQMKVDLKEKNQKKIEKKWKNLKNIESNKTKVN